MGLKTERSVPKGLKREAKNCQQRGVTRAQHLREIVWKKVRSIWWKSVLIYTLKTETSNFVMKSSLHLKPVGWSGLCCCTCMCGLIENKSG